MSTILAPNRHLLSFSWGLKKITRVVGRTIVKDLSNMRDSGDFDEQKNKLEHMEAIMRNHIPKTKLYQLNNGSYKIIQQKIEGRHLYEINKEDLSRETLMQIYDLLELYRKYVDSYSGELFDILWTPNMTIKNKYIRKLYNLWNSFNRNSFWASSNIVIEDETEKPYFVDVISKNAEKGTIQYIKNNCRNFILSAFYNHHIGRLRSKLDDWHNI